MSDFLIVFLVIYIFLSIIECLAMGILASEYYDETKYRACPPIYWGNEISDDNELNTFGRIVLCTLLMVLSIAALLIWYVALFIIATFAFLWGGFLHIFKKK